MTRLGPGDIYEAHTRREQAGLTERDFDGQRPRMPECPVCFGVVDGIYDVLGYPDATTGIRPVLQRAPFCARCAGISEDGILVDKVLEREGILAAIENETCFCHHAGGAVVSWCPQHGYEIEKGR